MSYWRPYLGIRRTSPDARVTTINPHRGMYREQTKADNDNTKLSIRRSVYHKDVFETFHSEKNKIFIKAFTEVDSRKYYKYRYRYVLSIVVDENLYKTFKVKKDYCEQKKNSKEYNNNTFQ